MKNTFVLFMIILLTLSSVAQDWPDWRGINRDAVFDDSGMLDEFATSQLNPKWKVPISAGYSGPTVANGKVYITDRLEAPTEAERILCFDESTGAKVWEYSYNCEYRGVGYPAGPRASVVIENNRAYALGTMGNLFCLNANTGELIWEKDLNKEYKIRMPIWGISATPLIVDEKLVLQISGSNNACALALDKNTGKEVWRNLNDMAGYSAPIVIGKGENKIVVFWTENSLSGLDSYTGKVVWQIPWNLRSGMAIATPVFYKNYLFVSCFYNGSMLVKLNDDLTSASIVWQREGESERNTDALHCVMNTPLILEDYIYGVDSYGELRCLQLLTGNRIWEDQTAVKRNRWANIHFMQSETKTWMFNEQGELIISKLSPVGYEEISRALLIEPTKKQLGRGVTWSHPAMANNHVFIRNDKELICVDLSKK